VALIRPFTPLVSLHTREDIGIAYAYWEHLLRPEQQKKLCDSPDSQRDKSSIWWAVWWKTFIQPFVQVLQTLRSGCARGQVHYGHMKKYAAEGRIPFTLYIMTIFF
jgi:hypothetical protein